MWRTSAIQWGINKWSGKRQIQIPQDSRTIDKNTLTAALSVACLEIRLRNEEVINSTRNRIYLLKNWISTCVRNDQKYICGHRLYACINTWKFKGLASREITPSPEIKKVSYMARHFNHHRKINRMLITRPICI